VKVLARAFREFRDTEAVELARAYSTPEAVSFVNGVLGSMIRSK